MNVSPAAPLRDLVRETRLHPSQLVLPIFVVPDRSKLIAAISEPYVGMKK